MKRKIKCISTSLVLASIIAGTSVANISLASDLTEVKSEVKGDSFTEDELKSLEEDLRKDGTDEDTIIRLIEKLKDGEIWDSFKPEYKDLKPQISTENYSKTVYPDGSYCIEKTEPVYNYSPRAISTVKSIKVVKHAVLVNMSFYADYKKNTATGKAMITSQYGYNVQVVGGTYTEDTKGYVTGWANPTNAWYAIRVNISQLGVNIYNGRLWIKLFANSNGHWQNDNFPF
ncbi:MAG: hypothetical protein Q4P31_01895 [Andreesenia angusta]|nr:hypothetical protein [Andreesenia angusta]